MQPTPASQLFTEIVLQVFNLSGLLTAEGDRLTKPFGLTSARWKILGALGLSGQALTVAQIANQMGQSRQGVQRIADELAKEGLVVYQDNPQHKISKLVALSAAGHEKYQLLDEMQVAWANELTANLSADALQHTLEQLKTLQGALQK